MIGRLGLETPALLAARYPKLAALGLVVLLFATLASLPMLRFDNNLERSFATSSEHSKAYARLMRSLGQKTEEVVFLAEGDRPFTAEDYAKMRDFALELQLTDRVAAVVSPFLLRFGRKHPHYPGEAVFPQQLRGAEIAARLAAFESGDQRLQKLISNDRKAAIIIASVQLEKGDAAQAVLDRLASLSATFATPNMRYAIGGKLAASLDLIGSIKRDLLVLNALGALLAAVLALAIFRGLRNAIVAIAPAVLGAGVSLSVYVWLGYPITVLSNTLPILVLVLGLADSVHLTMHLLRESRDQSFQDRLETTIRAVGPACALTSVTTAIAFTAIAISDNQQLFEFAVLGATAVLLSHVVVIVAFTLFARMAALEGGTSPASAAWLRAPGFIYAVVFRGGRATIAVSLVVVVLAAWGYSQSRAWFNFARNIPESSTARLTNDILQYRFGGLYRIWIELDTAGDNDLRTTAGWQRLVRLTRAIESAAPGTPVVSLVSLARWLGRPDVAPNQREMQDLPDGLRSVLVDRARNVARIIVIAPEPMRTPETLAQHDRLTAAARDNGASTVSGLPVVLRHEAIAIIRQLSLGLVIAALVSVLVIASFFGWPSLVWVLLIPNVLPVLVVASAVHLLNAGQIDPVVVLALTVAFGIAVDDSIHFVNMFGVLRSQGQAVDAAIGSAIERTGRVMIATTLLIVLGLAVTQFSDLAPCACSASC